MTASPFHAALSAPPSSAQQASSAFARLDAIVQSPEAFGVMRIAAEAGAFAAVGRHVSRRCAQLARPAIVLADAPAAEAWRELARRLEVSFDARSGHAGSSHPAEVAAKIARAATGKVVVVGEHHHTVWGGAVADELARLSREAERRMLLVVLRRHDDRREERTVAPRGQGRHEDALDLSLELGSLTPDDARRWWGALLSEDAFLSQPQLARLAVLDRWWEVTRAAPIRTERDDTESLDPDTRRLLALLGGASQALGPDSLRALGLMQAAEALVDAQLACLDAGGAITLSDGVAAPELGERDRRRLAEVLAEPCWADGWSTMRAAELFAQLGDIDEAERCAFSALRMLGDGVARRDLWARWEDIVDRLADDRLELLIRSAEHALDLGDGERADVMARAAMALEPERFDVLLLHGRASYARGDITTATLSLTRALTGALSGGERARAAGALSQARYLGGDPDQAARYAEEAIDSADDAETRLGARNVLGKLLLAREAWSEAEQHFAHDAYEAAAAGVRTSELRARLNRAIAILYLGRRDEARALLEEVMADGDRYGVPSAVAFALSNLASIAILDHDYRRALQLSERAIEVRRQLGGRIELVLPITNLTELRLRLGLVDEAEQGLRFGVHACADGLPLSHYAYFAKTAAAIHVERGDTVAATKELTAALSGASSSGDRSVLAQCHRIAARIALEDGDLPRARTAVSQAKELRHTAFGRADLAVLEARLARAAGDPFLEVAHQALRLAQDADDPESMRAAQVMLFHAHRLEGDLDSARSHLRAAMEQRDRVARALPEELRRRYLERRTLAELRELELDDLELDEEVISQAPPTVASRGVARKSPVGRRLVGDSAPMRTLRATTRRVAPTEATILIHGPTGTGKELVAEAVHQHSQRSSGPLVKVNCAALVETLLLSELFGHEKGAFTGASARRRGRFELAEGGTLFLDEIGDISPRTQVALLRVLQDGTYERVGGTTQLTANVRIVCATHRDLRAMVERGEFREDLYYRLCGVVVEVPQLRDRVEDIPALTQALLEQAQRTSGIEPKPLTSDAVRLLSRHAWPGNVRELENAVRVAALFSRGDAITAEDLTDHVESLREAAGGESASLPVSEHCGASIAPSEVGLDSWPPPASSSELVYAEIKGGLKLSEMKKKLEQECITRALVESGGNITKAAGLLGMKRPRLSQLVKQYDLGKVLEEIKS